MKNKNYYLLFGLVFSYYTILLVDFNINEISVSHRSSTAEREFIEDTLENSKQESQIYDMRNQRAFQEIYEAYIETMTSQKKLSQLPTPDELKSMPQKQQNAVIAKIKAELFKIQSEENRVFSLQKSKWRTKHQETENSISKEYQGFDRYKIVTPSSSIYMSPMVGSHHEFNAELRKKLGQVSQLEMQSLWSQLIDPKTNSAYLPAYVTNIPTKGSVSFPSWFKSPQYPIQSYSKVSSIPIQFPSKPVEKRNAPVTTFRNHSTN